LLDFGITLKMSNDGWNLYIGNLIANSKGSCDKVTLIGLNGGAHWTLADHPQGVTLSAAEGGTIASAMSTSNDTTFQSSGIILGGVKYNYLRRMDNTVLGKKKDNGAITIANSKTCIVIAHTMEGQQHGLTNTAVAGIIDYLESMNM